MERERLVKPRGRPRSDQAHTAILTAAVALIREVGYDAVTMDGIAERAGAGKATLYRRWPNKEALAADAIRAIVRAVPVPDTGRVHDDLVALMRVALGMYADPATGALLSGFVAAMARSDAIAASVRGSFVSAWRDSVTELLARGMLRGELPESLDAELAMDLVFGPPFYRFLLTGEPLDERYGRAVVAAALGGLTAGPDAA